MTDAVRSLTSGRLLARSALWNFVGLAAPMLVAAFAIPLLISGMGKERFGLLAIIWMGVGYFSLFDMGLGRALTKMVSERLGREEAHELGSLVWTALHLLALLGTFGAICLMFVSEVLVTGLLNVPVELHEEGVVAFRVLAIGLPIVIVTAGLIGLLKAHQRFGTISAVRVPLGVLTFGGPLLSLQFSPSIVWATTVLLLGRVAGLIAYYVVCAAIRPELRRPRSLEACEVKPLLSFGGWLTVTNIVGPLMTYLDRFFVGALLSMSAVTYYVTPYEVLSRLQLLPKSVMGVLFPAMAAAHSGDRERLPTLYSASARAIYCAMLPLTAGAFLLAPEALTIWLGDGFSSAATPVVRWLAIGMIVNTLARPALTVLQSAGRPDLVAKTHLTELPPYLALVWWLTSAFGIAGCAAAWALRAVADTVALNALAGRTLPELHSLVIRAYGILFATSIAFAGFWFLDPLSWRLLALVVVGAVASHLAWPIVQRVIAKQRSIDSVESI